MSDTTITLTRDEAIVLFEWLAQRNSESANDPSAEQIVLWAVESLLKKALVEPFLPNYPEIVAAARDRVLGNQS